MADSNIEALNIEDNIEKYCRDALNNPIGAKQFSIYRVPSHIRKNNVSYYEPRMVSIGPYHWGKKHLRAMEEHKWRYLGEYINRGKGRKEDYLQGIWEMEPKIRTCYFESFNLNEEQFVETILLDSCFIIQLFIKWSYMEADPVRNIGWVLPLLMADLIMIENQIPFSVLQKMYSIYCDGSSIPPDNRVDKRPSLTKLVVQSLDTMHNRNAGVNSNLPVADADIKHLLHIYYLLFVPTPENIPSTVLNCPTVPTNHKEISIGQPPGGHIVLLLVCNPTGCCESKGMKEENRSPRMIPSARELKESGVKIKKKKDCKSILDISFKNGVLEIPSIVLEESIRSRYLNLIAFEQCISTDQKHLTSYAVFMDCLINTPEDVIVLQGRGIIENKLADTTEAAKFFKQLRDCAYMDYDDHYLKQVFVDITKHRRAFWPKHRAKLCRDYFSSPWTIFSLGAAVLLLGITIFKTIYFIVTTFGHHHR